jgi:uncharacterized protein YdeI (YjbR/CyaY-like superfamily)
MEELTFRTRKDFRRWLSARRSSQGVWLILGKDGTVPTLTAAEALEEALCFGWIDGQIKRIDGSTYRKYFSPRRKGSVWSERNKNLVARLTTAGLMTARGLAAVEQARKDGTWDAAQDRTIPQERFAEFEEAIGSSRQALAHFRAMPPSARQQFVGFFFEAKREETRVRRLAKLVGLLEQNRRLM